MTTETTPLYTLGHTPSVRDLVNDVRSVSNWELLGLQLGVEQHELEVIDVSENRIPNKKMKMFQVWLKSNPGASWDDLVRALEVMGEKRVAGEVSRAHDVQPSATTGNNKAYQLVTTLMCHSACLP